MAGDGLLDPVGHPHRFIVGGYDWFCALAEVHVVSDLMDQSIVPEQILQGGSPRLKG